MRLEHTFAWFSCLHGSHFLHHYHIDVYKYYLGIWLDILRSLKTAINKESHQTKYCSETSDHEHEHRIKINTSQQTCFEVTTYGLGSVSRRARCSCCSRLQNLEDQVTLFLSLHLCLRESFFFTSTLFLLKLLPVVSPRHKDRAGLSNHREVLC